MRMTAAAGARSATHPADAEEHQGATGRAAEANESAPQVLAGKTAAVVGGGPGGMLCAAHLARLGAAVEVFEARDPAAADAAKPPPPVWSIQLGPNAKTAIEGAGLSADFGPEWRFVGSARHAAGQGTVFMSGWEGHGGVPAVDPSPTRIALATQRGIVAHLRAECERVYGEAVRVRYGLRAVGGDVCGGEVVLEDAAGQRTARAFDMVIGADGVGSAVRGLMQEQDKKMKVSVEQSAVGMVCSLVRSPGHPSTFASLETASGEPFQGAPEGYAGDVDGCSFHFVFPAAAAPPALGVCGVSVRRAGEEVVLNISTDKKEVAKMRSADEVAAALAQAYPHLPTTWRRQTAEFVRDEAVDEGLRLRSPTFVFCNKIASGRAVLLGDAAHSVSPNLGVGCTAALQDALVLSRACIAAAGDVEAAAARYNAERLEDARTLAQVSKSVDAVANFKFHRDVVKAALALPYFMARGRMVASKFPLSGLLRANIDFDGILQASDSFAEIRKGMRLYIARLVAVAAAAAAALAAIARYAFSLLPA